MGMSVVPVLSKYLWAGTCREPDSFRRLDTDFGGKLLAPRKSGQK